MQRISEELVRKRAEHNNCEIGTLEELSLHQDNLDKLEHLQHWCKDLKILLLHSNLINRIENIGKLKKLEYLNLSINNIERIENLEGCESLKKLDLTLNFIGDILSIENLKKNIFLEELLLNGNPCTDFSGYRDFVIATLPQLNELDGKEIFKSDRILALQKYDEIRPKVIIEQNNYLIKRKIQKKEKEESLILSEDKIKGVLTEEQRKNFWESPSENTPEDRIQMAIMSKKSKETPKPSIELEDPRYVKKRIPKLFDENGRPYNINEGNIPFRFEDDYYGHFYKLDLAVYRYLDSSLIDIDVQPNYIKIMVKKKVFQLRFEEEVSPDQSNATRSQTTGHLVVTMPKRISRSR
ncbi:dynein axonemal assembly factor 11 isoform X2 [Halyomorpha halys]|uniref:dynein axonemal assembly factor 11 isoform X2 n=1 Tax=Halyomorpha halys TaxID=286706 RepID=UPI0006D514CA